ncbi:general stress protein [Legionella sainthelensi]|uniref:Uncharacterized protein n=1 Tax=Legionella sainthelensi TaxID=28087 RepID=A0A2H5FRV3_9GAMM|nr:general stress protein [Legionella sainthelensi]AUH74285.1 hypothetical protein CAB17_20330 [Legionella sainthelensi]
MTTSKIIEIFPNEKTAEKAYKYALECGYTPNDITVIMSENYYKSDLMKQENINTLENVGQGGATGAAIGSILGAIVALGGNLIIPGIGIIIAGPLAGLVVGTLMGTLLALGVSETKAQEYAEAIDSGKVILYVDVIEPSNLEKEWKEIKMSEGH